MALSWPVLPWVASSSRACSRFSLVKDSRRYREEELNSAGAASGRLAPALDGSRALPGLRLRAAEGERGLGGAVVERLGPPVAGRATDARLVVAQRGDAVAGEVLADRGQVAGAVAARRPGAVQQDLRSTRFSSLTEARSRPNGFSTTRRASRALADAANPLVTVTNMLGGIAR